MHIKIPKTFGIFIVLIVTINIILKVYFENTYIFKNIVIEYYFVVQNLVLFIFVIFYLLLLKKSFNNTIDELKINLESSKTILKQNLIYRLVENINHEINTPLSVIKIKLKKCKDKEILEAIHSIEAIIDKISETKHIEKQSGSVYNTILICLKMVSLTEQNMNYEIDEILKTKKAKLPAGELKPILINHIKNSLEANAFTIKFKADNNNLIIEDDGNGIPENIINKVYEPNFSSKESLFTRGNGMYISKLILNNNNLDEKILKTSRAGTSIVIYNILD